MVDTSEIIQAFSDRGTSFNRLAYDLLVPGQTG
jgi:hypothetical protein